MATRIRAAALAALATAFLGTAWPGAARAQEPLARFEERLCPGIIGMQREFAESIVGRIRENAEALGLKVADPEGCEPNVLIIFLDDGQDYLRRLERKDPRLFDSLTLPQRRALLAGEGPVWAFAATRVRTRDGMRVDMRDNLSNIPQTTMWSAHSKIYTATRRDIVTSFVLFDRNRLEGLSLTQLADHATLRALAEQPEEVLNADSPSILNLFAGEDRRQAELTAIDRAFLAGLYEGVPNLPGDVRLAEIEERVGKARLAKP